MDWKWEPRILYVASTFQDEDYEGAYKKLKSIIPIIPSLGIYQKTSFMKHKHTKQKLEIQVHRSFLYTELRLSKEPKEIVACNIHRVSFIASFIYYQFHLLWQWHWRIIYKAQFQVWSTLQIRWAWNILLIPESPDTSKDQQDVRIISRRPMNQPPGKGGTISAQYNWNGLKE